MARLGLLALLALSLAAPATASPAAAVALAPQYSSSEPADGEELHQAPDQVTVTFSEPLDPSSEMIVEDHCGNRLDDRNVEVSLNEMTVGIAKKPAGHYMVTYVADGIGSATGSNQGRFSFKVHAGEPCGGSGSGHDGHRQNTGDGHDGHNEGKHSGRHSDHGKGDHQGAEDHSRNDGSSGTHSGGHSSDAMSEHGRHSDTGPAAGAADHSAHKADDNNPGEVSKQRRVPDLAAGETPLPDLNPDSTAVLLALLLCAAFGALGGWILRVSAQR